MIHNAINELSSLWFWGVYVLAMVVGVLLPDGRLETVILYAGFTCGGIGIAKSARFAKEPET